jgi:hypothetical protein
MRQDDRALLEEKNLRLQLLVADLLAKNESLRQQLAAAHLAQTGPGAASSWSGRLPNAGQENGLA